MRPDVGSVRPIPARPVGVCVPRSGEHEPFPSELAEGADRLGLSPLMLRRTLRWFAELPPLVRKSLLDSARRPHANPPRNLGDPAPSAMVEESEQRDLPGFNPE